MTITTPISDADSALPIQEELQADLQVIAVQDNNSIELVSIVDKQPIELSLPIESNSIELIDVITAKDSAKLFQYLANLPPDIKNPELQNAAITLANSSNLEWIISSLEQLSTDSELIPAVSNFFLFAMDHCLRQHDFIQDYRQRLLTTLQILLTHRIEANTDELPIAWNLSLIHNKLGDFYLFRKHPGDMEQALASYNAGLKIREHLYQKNRNNAQFIRDLSISHEKLGDFYLQRNEKNDPNLALAAYTASLEFDKRLYHSNTKLVQAARDLSVIQNKIGDLRLQRSEKNDIKLALSAYSTSFKIRNRLYRTNRKNIQFARDLLLSYSKLGDLYLKRGKSWDKARVLKTYTASLDLASKLYQNNQTDPSVAQDFARSHNKLGTFYLTRGEPGDIQRALASYSTCREILERLQQDNPKNFEAARNLVVIYNKLGSLYLRRKKPEDNENALLVFNTALKIAEQLYQTNPSLPQVARDLSVINNQLGDVYLSSGTSESTERALYAYNASMEIRERLHKARPDDVQIAKELAISYWKMATASQASPTTAQLWWDRCYRQFWNLAQQNNLLPNDHKYLQYAAQKASYSLDKPKVKLENKSSPQTESHTQLTVYPLRFTKRIVITLLIMFWIYVAGSVVKLKDPILFEAINNQIYQTTATTVGLVVEEINKKLEFKPILDKALKISNDAWAAVLQVQIPNYIVQIPDYIKNFFNTLDTKLILDKIAELYKFAWNFISTIQIPDYIKNFFNNLDTKLIFNKITEMYKFAWHFISTIQIPDYIKNFFNDLDTKLIFNKIAEMYKFAWNFISNIQIPNYVKNFFNNLKIKQYFNNLSNTWWHTLPPKPPALKPVPRPGKPQVLKPGAKPKPGQPRVIKPGAKPKPGIMPRPGQPLVLKPGAKPKPGIMPRPGQPLVLKPGAKPKPGQPQALKPGAKPIPGQPQVLKPGAKPKPGIMPRPGQPQTSKPILPPAPKPAPTLVPQPSNAPIPPLPQLQ